MISWNSIYTIFFFFASCFFFNSPVFLTFLTFLSLVVITTNTGHQTWAIQVSLP